MTDPTWELSNPFPGLRPFGPEEAHLFFGRDEQVDDLLQRLGTSRFLAVMGPSGSGKSSLVLAGLLPALHGGFVRGYEHGRMDREAQELRLDRVGEAF